jgi:hypothetical protein
MSRPSHSLNFNIGVFFEKIYVYLTRVISYFWLVHSLLITQGAFLFKATYQVTCSENIRNPIQSFQVKCRHIYIPVEL